jgi:hypothetical protein
VVVRCVGVVEVALGCRGVLHCRGAGLCSQAYAVCRWCLDGGGMTWWW